MLRKDIRKEGSVSQPPSPEFEQWWALCGRREYPAWGELSESDRTFLGELVLPCRLEGITINLPRAVALLENYRPDVTRQYAAKGQKDPIAFAGWFFMLGIKEHALEGIVNQALILTLDRPVLEISHDVQASNLADPVPSVTVLMRLVWQLLDAEKKQALSLSIPESRGRFLIWFFCEVILRYSLAMLVSSRWKNWLLQDQLIHATEGIKVPRFALMAYKINKELNNKIALNNSEGANELRLWAERSVQAGGEWAWLKPQPPTEESGQEMAPSDEHPFGVNLYGFAFGELGIGEDLRMAVAVCEAASIPYRVVNINAGDQLRQADDALALQVKQSLVESPYSVNVFCLPAFDMVARIFLALGSAPFDKQYNIGWWPWELSVWPKGWKNAFDLVDEVWAGSPFSFSMYQKSTLKPSYLMPLAASVGRIKVSSRDYFSLPASSFLFLYVFDFNSHLNRKNPSMLIKAFKNAFPDLNQAVGLVFKVMNTNPSDAKWNDFVMECKQDPRIQIINKTMDRPDVLGLIEVCDAYVSPHRAEGFGRTLAEAMLLGKPVLATNYSGNAGYMDPELTFPIQYDLVPLDKGDYHFIEPEDGAVWAEPSIAHLSESLKAALLFPPDLQRVEQLKRFSNDQFGITRTAKLFKLRMAQIKSQLGVQKIDRYKS
jgi:glycosyltransferase involved in cell wall biosynthesis